MAEGGSACRRRLRRGVSILIALAGLVCLVICLTEQQHLRQALEGDIAELQLNCTGLRRGPWLHWQGGPERGRSFLHGPQLDGGQLRVRRDGIYRLHIQVTLANCSSSVKNAGSCRAALSVGICAPAPRSTSLLRLHFRCGCTVSSQRLTPLGRGDTLCTNLTLPLLPSPNYDQTFFGVQRVHP